MRSQKFTRLPLSQAHIENEILRMLDLMEERTDELAVLGEEAGKTEALHKSTRAKAILNAEGPATMRPHIAEAECEHELMEREIAAARYAACKESLNTIRAQVDALRTLSANVRRQT